jgi:hypothetical protein
MSLKNQFINFCQAYAEERISLSNGEAADSWCVAIASQAIPSFDLAASQLFQV